MRSIVKGYDRIYTLEHFSVDNVIDIIVDKYKLSDKGKNNLKILHRYSKNKNIKVNYHSIVDYYANKYNIKSCCYL